MLTLTYARSDLFEARAAAPAAPASRPALRPQTSTWPQRSLAAIQIGLDEIALKIVRPIVTGGHETIHVARAPLACDNEGPAFTERVLEALRQYGRACHLHDAVPRAVAGSAASGVLVGADLVDRALRETATEIELLWAREEAQLLCRGVLGKRHAQDRALLVAMDGDAVSLTLAVGDLPVALWDIGLEAARWREIGATAGALPDEAFANRLRDEARRIVSAARLGTVPGTVRQIVAVSGARHVLRGLGGQRCGDLGASRLRQTNDRLMAHWRSGRSSSPAPRELDRLLFRALILEAIVERAGADRIESSEAGLLDGVLAEPRAPRRREIQTFS